jgi:hypothetical protein
MGNLIISETERKNILSLYEQNSDAYKKENDFLKKYIGKTFNVYSDLNQQDIEYKQIKIQDINYDGRTLYINSLPSQEKIRFLFFNCLYNPSRIGDVINNWSDTTPNIYAKSLISDINQKGITNGIKWCQKPKADFGVKSVNEDIKSW